MTKNIIRVLTVVLILYPYIIFSQNHLTDSHLTGHIIDAETKEHIPFASVIIKGTSRGITSDASGHFLLKHLPAGKLWVEASYTGYKPDLKEVEILPNRTIEVHFSLTPRALDIGDVVVTGSRNETKREESSTIVNVASGKLFEKTSSNNVAEVLNFQPGLRVEYSCSNCGVPQLRINGLSGQYSQILLDSRPIFSSLATVYGLEQMPAGMIERVEVIRGGGSALFGSNAIGGVVNIITKEPLRSSAVLSNNTNIFKDGKTDINTAFNASIMSDDFKTGAYLFGVVKQRQDYDRNKDGFSDLPELNSETVGARVFHNFSAASRLTAEYHHIHEFRRGGNLLERPPHEADIAEQLNHIIDGGGLKYDYKSDDLKHRLSIYSSVQYIHRKSYFGTRQNLEAYGKTTDLTLVAGGQYTLSFDKLWFMPAQLTTGIEYNDNRLNDKMLGYHRTIDQASISYGGYIQNEWKNKQWGILIGGRLDKHNKVKNVIFSPRANLRYTLSEHLAFRASYSAGYRAPQAYDEDLHVAAVGGEVAIINIADNLRPEYSQSVSGSIDLYEKWGQVEANLLIEGFYTNLNDVFTLVESGHDNDGNLLLERRNASGANVYGVNLEFKTGWMRTVTLDAGFTLQKSVYKEPFVWSENPNIIPQKKMFRTPNLYGFATLGYSPLPPLALSANINYTGTMLVQHYAGYVAQDTEIKTRDFWELGARAAYQFKLSQQFKLEINGGVKNILDQFQKDLDEGIDKDSKYIYGPVFPRTFFVGVKLML